MKLVRGQKVQMEVFACAIYFVLLSADIHPSSLSSSLIWATTVNEFPTPGKNRSLICHTLVRTTFHFFLGTRACLVFFLRAHAVYLGILPLRLYVYKWVRWYYASTSVAFCDTRSQSNTSGKTEIWQRNTFLQNWWRLFVRAEQKALWFMTFW